MRETFWFIFKIEEREQQLFAPVKVIWIVDFEVFEVELIDILFLL